MTALATAALGLAIAGSFAVTTSAQPPSDRTNGPVSVIAQPTEAPDVTPTPEPRSVQAFENSSEGETSSNPAVRAAVIAEQAAQRSEQLAKSAEAATAATRAAAKDARQKKLSEADQARNATAATLAEEEVRQAVIARLAAEKARAAAEEALGTPDPADPTTDPNALSIPTGGAAVSPVPGAVIGAHFGQYGIWARYHTGLDFRAAYGTPISAVEAGVVLYAGNSGDWAGNHVAIKQADGTTSMYSHMSSMAAHAGQTVQAGQVIGYVGQTGRAFGPHLHFELYPAGVKYGDIYHAIDPQPWLTANGVITH